MAAESVKFVYSFGGGKAEGRASMKALLGGKGANLAEMANLGLPVPPGFTISTEVCTAFYANNRKYPAGLEAEVGAALAQIEALTGNRFGDAANPLLVSVRSGARASMPGHDGYRTELRPQRCHRRRPGRAFSRPALRL